MNQPHRFVPVAFAVALAFAATNYVAEQGAFPEPGGQNGFPRGPGASGAPQPPLPAGSGLIEGIVQSGDTMRPLDQVSITLMVAGPNGGRSGSSTVLTDSSGHFSFPNVALALYSILAQRDGYFGSNEIGVPRPSASKSGVLSASQPHAELVLSLTPTLTITGRVTDWTGGSVANVQVDAMMKQYRNGQLSFVSMKTGTSDDRGIYRLFGLLPGEYFVRALAKPAAPFATTYSGEVPGATNAISLVLKTGTEPVSDVRLLRSSPVKVSGRVILSDTAVIGKEQFWLVPQNAPYMDSIETAVSLLQNSQPGSFQFQARLPGTYQLFYIVQTQLRNAQTARDTVRQVYSGRTTIDVRNTDIDNVTLDTTPITELEVRFNLSGDAGLAPPGVPNLLSLVPLDRALPTELRPTPAPGTGRRVLGPSAEPRKFSNVIEGEYRLYPGVREGGLQVDGYISDMRQGGKDIIENGIITVGKGAPEPVEITLKRGGATVQGVVQDSGRPPGTAFVILIPNGTRRQNPALYRRYVTEPDGRFTLPGLSPGSYTIFAWASDPAGAELIPEFIQRYAEVGIPIVLNADSAPSGISVPLIRNPQ